ncbi:MAG: polyprenol monophosphomannose synthase [Anaerolineales bacterium]|nr:polyprenol monophosphomannose synthase [Anaerolineales bacterium]
MQLTIVIPTYNEAENLPNLTAALFGLPLDVHLLVVDDASPDGTGEIAEGLKSDYPGRVSVVHRSGKLGLGTAYIHGFHQALAQGAQVVGQMDADFSHPPEKLSEMTAALETCDVVIGSRYIQGGRLDERWPLWRKGLSGFGNLYARAILGLAVRDTTAGFRIWRRETLEGMPLERIQSNGYAFQVEMTYVATRLGYRFNEIPIYFADRRWGESKMSWQIQMEAAVRVWQLLLDYRDLHPRKR